MTGHNVMICFVISYLFNTVNYLFSHYSALLVGMFPNKTRVQP